jgi:putative alpha-1,2-mannosidase
MAYLTATRYGLTHIAPTEQQRSSGWRQVWRHPSGALAMRHPSTGEWVTSMDGGWSLDEGWANGLHAAALRIERRLRLARAA